MGKWDGLNRRKFPRVNFPCLVKVRRQDASGEEIILTHTENVGQGGVCIILKHNVKMFSEVDLEIDLLDMEDHVVCKGKVVWNVRRGSDKDAKPAHHDLGVEFLDLKPQDLVRLQAMVVRLVKQNLEV